MWWLVIVVVMVRLSGFRRGYSYANLSLEGVCLWLKCVVANFPMI